MCRNIFLLMLMCISFASGAQSITGYEYWFDHNDDNRVSRDSQGGDISISVDASTLMTGIHTLSLRAKDSDGRWSTPLSKYFLRINTEPTETHITGYEYWTDCNYASRKSAAASGGDIHIVVDASEAVGGIHTIFYRVKDSHDRWSAPLSAYFLKVEGSEAAASISECEYWMDKDFTSRTTSAVSEDLVSLDIDASALVSGVHTLTYRVKATNGKWSAPLSAYFLKVASSEAAPSISECEYWMDKDFDGRATTAVAEGLVSLDIDVSKMTSGAHTLTYRVKDTNGKWSAPQSQYYLCPFIDFSQGENRIIGYSYWFNDETDNVKYVNVEPTDSLTLNTWIDVTDISMKVTPENVTVIYTDSLNTRPRIAVKNRLYTMFKDANKRWSQAHCDTFVTLPSGNSIDFTAFIVNPDASSGNAGWTTSGKMSIQTKDDNPYFSLGKESDNGWTAQMKQTIAGVPAGQYILTVNGCTSKDAKLTIAAAGFETEFEPAEDNVWGTATLMFITDGQPFDIVIKAEGAGKNQWAAIDDLNLTMGSNSLLIVKMPESADMNGYKNQKLVVASSQSKQTLTTTSAKEYAFRGLSTNGIYRVSMQTMYGEEIAAVDNVSLETGENSITLPELKGVEKVRLNVTGPDDSILTSKVTTTWYGEDGRYLSSGREIEGMVEGSKLVYTVTLSDSLGVIYTEPGKCDYVVKAESNIINVKLSPHSPITLTGTVRNNYIKLSGAQVNAVQWINGRYTKSASTTTDRDGNFSLPLLNDSTRLTISYSGYLDKALAFGKIEDANLGNITLEEIVGTTLHLNINYQKSVKEGVESDVQRGYSDMNNVEFTVFDVTADSLVTKFNVQNSKIITHYPLSTGTKLLLTARSRTNDFAESQSEAIVTDSTVVALPLAEKGSIKAAYLSSVNSECVGILYDASGVQKSRATYTGSSITFNHLDEGEYTLVSMGASRLLGNVMNIEDLAAIGLNPGEHYSINDVTVENGVIREVKVETIPEIDEMLFYYTGDGTMFSVNKNSVTVGNYITLTTKIDFKEEYRDGVEDVKLQFDLPEGCQYVDGSAIFGTTPIECSKTDGKLTIDLSASGYGDRVRFCVIPTQGGSYVPSVYVLFKNDGDRITQPLGNVAFTAEEMSINVPSVTSNKQITVSGTTVPYSTVNVMDNGSLMGTTTAKADGSWMINEELLKAYNLSRHQIMGEVITPNGTLLNTESKEVEFNISYNSVKKVTMINTCGREYITVFDFEDPQTKSPIYSYSPSHPNFTFLIDFEDNRPERIKNVVLLVETTSGISRELNAEYDERNQKWLTTGKFTSSELPVTVGVYYNSNDSIILDYAYYDSVSKIIESMVDTAVSEYDNDKNEVDTTKEEINNIPENEPDRNYRIMTIITKFIRKKLPELNDVKPDENSSPKIQDFNNRINSATTVTEKVEIFNDLDKYIKDLSKPFQDAPSIDFNQSYIHDSGTSFVMDEITQSVIDMIYSQVDKFIPTNTGDKVWTNIEDIEGKTVCTFVDESKNQYLRIERSVSDSDFWSNLHDVSDLLCQAGTDRLLEEFLNGIALEQNLLDDISIGNFDIKELGFKNVDNVVAAKNLSAFKGILGIFSSYADIINASIDEVKELDEIEDLLGNIYLCTPPSEWEKYENRLKIIRAYYKFDKTGEGIVRGGFTLVETGMTVSGSNTWAGIGEGLFKMKTLNSMSANISNQLEKNLANATKDIDWEGCLKKYPGLKLPNKAYYIGAKAKGIIDPSGYVYEAVSSNRLEGVTATVFQKTQEEDMYGDKHDIITKWDAEAYSQKNPLLTDANGLLTSSLRHPKGPNGRKGAVGSCAPG